MDHHLLAENSHWEDVENFYANDRDLKELKLKPLIHSFSILNELPKDKPGIYTLRGTHQSGKTTLLKCWMEKLLKNISPKTLLYFSCEEIENYHELLRSLQKQLELMPRDGINFIILDDINSVRDWEKAIKPLYENGHMQQSVLMLSGSNLNLSEKTQLYFPQHRGNATKKDFLIQPLSFRETVLLKHKNTTPTSHILTEEINQFMIHGGYLSAINEYAATKQLSDTLLKNFSEWLRKETEKYGKQERYLREILTAIFKHYNNQITWNALAQELTIDHPKTIGDYLAMLDSLDIVFIQYALLEDSLKPAPKKARKLMFADPFIFHVMQGWIVPTKNLFENQIKNTLNNQELFSRLIEACVITQFRRYYPTYYIKAEGEVDIAYIYNQRFWPIVVTWTTQLRAKDLKQILKYPNGRILTKSERSGIIQQIKTESVPLALWQLES